MYLSTFLKNENLTSTCTWYIFWVLGVLEYLVNCTGPQPCSTPIFKALQILKIEDLYTVQLYKLYYKLRNNLLSSYFRTFIPYYHNDHNTHDLRYIILRLLMTRREYFAECSKYQFLKLLREIFST